MKEGALSKPIKQVITGIHLLNITGLAISPSGMLFSASAEGSVQQFQIGKIHVIIYGVWGWGGGGALIIRESIILKPLAN
jgi:hypothetical protein